MPTNVATVLSVNVGRAREFDYNGRPAKSAIWKSPVAGRIAARGVNLEGDDQADRKAHGGPDKIGVCLRHRRSAVVGREARPIASIRPVRGKSHDGRSRGERRARWRALGDRHRRV